MSTKKFVFLISYSYVLLVRILVGRLEGSTPLGRPGRTREDKIKMDLQVVGRMSHDRNRWRAVVNAVMKLQVQ
jgi:hypothetical protein